jgi:hypothetical protein
MTYTTHTRNGAHAQLPAFLDACGYDLPDVPELETLPLLRPDHEPDGSLYDWAVESIQAATAWRDEAEALALQNRYLQDELASALVRERRQRWRWLKDLALTAGCVFVMGSAVLIVLNALP